MWLVPIANGPPRHFTALRKSVGIGGIANIDQAAPSKLDLAARAPVLMMTRVLLPLVAASAASPDVLIGHDPARGETDSPVEAEQEFVRLSNA